MSVSQPTRVWVAIVSLDGDHTVTVYRSLNDAYNAFSRWGEIDLTTIYGPLLYRTDEVILYDYLAIEPEEVREA